MTTDNRGASLSALNQQTLDVQSADVIWAGRGLAVPFSLYGPTMRLHFRCRSRGRRVCSSVAAHVTPRLDRLNFAGRVDIPADGRNPLRLSHDSDRGSLLVLVDVGVVASSVLGLLRERTSRGQQTGRPYRIPEMTS